MKRRSGLNFSRRRKKFNVPLFKEIMTWVLECAIVIAIAYALVSSFGFRTTVVGNAMQDTLQSEEQIFVNRFVYMVRAPKQGDVVVFLPNGNEKSHYYVRRVIACPGDTVQIKNGKVYINGEELEEDYLSSSVRTEAEGGLLVDFTVPEGTVFAMGDNRAESHDCRAFGCIPQDKIESIVLFRFWPFDKFGKVE